MSFFKGLTRLFTPPKAIRNIVKPIASVLSVVPNPLQPLAAGVAGGLGSLEAVSRNRNYFLNRLQDQPIPQLPTYEVRGQRIPQRLPTYNIFGQQPVPRLPEYRVRGQRIPVPQPVYQPPAYYPTSIPDKRYMPVTTRATGGTADANLRSEIANEVTNTNQNTNTVNPYFRPEFNPVINFQPVIRIGDQSVRQVEGPRYYYGRSAYGVRR